MNREEILRQNKRFLLFLFRKAFNARAERQLQIYLIMERHRLTYAESKRLEADWLSIHNAITHFYEDSGLRDYFLKMRIQRLRA